MCVKKDYTTGLLNCKLSLNVNATGEPSSFTWVQVYRTKYLLSYTRIEGPSIVASSFESFDEFAEFARKQGEKDGATCVCVFCVESVCIFARVCVCVCLVHVYSRVCIYIYTCVASVCVSVCEM